MSNRPLSLEGTLASSRVLHALADAIALAAASDAPVLITGERGTSKERVARAIHGRSGRAAGPFVILGPDGRLEQAAGGTLFVGELAALDARAQAGLLTLGDARVIAASSHDLTPLLDRRFAAHVIHLPHPHEPADAGGVIRVPMGASMKEAEREVILRTLEAQAGNKKITAEILGISRRSLYNKLAEYGPADVPRKKL